MNKILICYNEHIELAKKKADIAMNYLLSLGIECIYDTDKSYIKNVNVIITFGGDGTILSVASKYIDYDIPIMGFNVGKLGFLSEFSTNYIKEGIDDLLANKYKICKRFLLKANLNSNDTYNSNKNDNYNNKQKQYLAINDFVVRNTEHSKLITLSAFANENYIGDYRSDGLIISTPTGSTAYSMACGGPIVYPDANVYCITPIAPHTLTLRPLIIPTNKIITIKLPINSNNNASIIADGNYVANITPVEELKISIYTKEASFIVPLESNYFEVLRNKLLWAEKITK